MATHTLTTFCLIAVYSLFQNYAHAAIPGDIAKNSSNWPADIHVIEADKYTNTDGASRLIKAGERGVLQRIENNNILIDFGSSGNFWIPHEKTDLEDAALAISNDPSLKMFPILTAQIGTKLVYFPNGEGRNITMEDNKFIKYYLCLYTDEYDADSILFLKQIDSLLLEDYFDHNVIRVVAFPSSIQSYSHYIKEFQNIPCILPQVREGYIQSLYQLPSEEPAFILADANGKILFRSPTIQIDHNIWANARIGSRTESKRRALRKVRDIVDTALAMIQE